MKKLFISLICNLLFFGCATTGERSLEERVYVVNQRVIIAIETATTILAALEIAGVELSEIQAKALLGAVLGLTELHGSLRELMLECELAGGLEACGQQEYINQAITTTADLARLVLLLSQEAK